VTTLVDSSVLLDVLAPSEWRAWSEEHLAAAADAGDVAINQIVYAEVAAGFATRERLDRTLQGVGIVRLNVPWTACWEAARASVDYRRRGGKRSAPLPDFFIGAHAVTAGLPLLTRDPRRVRAAFPSLDLIAPAATRPE
jgi:predicted nucleic acid-binding protein